MSEVLVWTFDLDAIDADAVGAALPAAERERAARFRFDIHRERWLAARGALRHVLGSVLEVAPEVIEFEYGEHGKPSLKGGGPFFNLSHSANRAVIGVSREAELGVDVERINPDRSRPEIAERFFAPLEIRELASLSGDAYAHAFFQIWARKEAVLKAVGTGIGGGLSSFAVPLGPMPVPIHIPSPDCWIGNLAHAFAYLQQEGFASAVALMGRKPIMRPVCDTVLRIPVRRTFKCTSLDTSCLD